MVKLSTSSHDWIQLFEGVPQETVVGPFLFKIDVNGNSVTKNCNLMHYADGTKSFSSHNNLMEARNNLKKTIGSVVSFFQNHQLKINASKTNLLVFVNHPKTILPEVIP